jgi:hypothetical protein
VWSWTCGDRRNGVSAAPAATPGCYPSAAAWAAQRFAAPRLETRIEATQPNQDHRLYQVLVELAEEDPLISVLKDELDQTITLAGLLGGADNAALLPQVISCLKGSPIHTD